MKRNGFVTIVVLWFGLLVCSFSLFSAALAGQYVRQVEAYRDGIRAACLAESTLLFSEQECQDSQEHALSPYTELTYPDVPLQEGESLRCIRKASWQGNHYEGTLRASACSGAEQMEKTCAVSFNATYDDEQQCWHFTFFNYRT